MTSRLLVLAPTLLMACADFDPGADPTEVSGADDRGDSADDPQPQPSAELFFTSRPGRCGRTSVIVTAWADAPGVGLVSNALCGLEFDDGTAVSLVGTQSYGCETEVDLTTAGDHTVRVTITDPTSGAVLGTLERSVYVYPLLTAELEVTAPACGLEFSWRGSSPEATLINIFGEPSDKLVGAEPSYYENTEYTVQVSEPGVYDAWMYAEQTRVLGEACNIAVTKQVTVTECAPGCDHP